MKTNVRQQIFFWHYISRGFPNFLFKGNFKIFRYIVKRQSIISINNKYICFPDAVIEGLFTGFLQRQMVESSGLFRVLPGPFKPGGKQEKLKAGLRIRIRNVFLGSGSGIIIPDPDPTNTKTNKKMLFLTTFITKILIYIFNFFRHNCHLRWW